MRNVFSEAEKRMKTFLKNKNKIRYSKELVVFFLMTGGILGFSEENSIKSSTRDWVVEAPRRSYPW